MRYAKGGWDFIAVPFVSGKKNYLVCMMLKPPQEHVGLLTTDVTDNTAKMAHASSRLGFVEVTLSPEEKNRILHSVLVLKQTR